MHPCKVGSAWEIQAAAKLNLYLEVLGPRADGFHALETLMVPVQVYDQLVYRPAIKQPLSLRVRDLRRGNQVPGQLGSDDNNLVLRAARLLAKAAEIAPSGQIDLVKRIPVQAGMGGGSSDAASALLLFNEAWSLGYTRQQLQPLAAELGSDVPFFLNSTAAICRGRGEIIETIAGLPRLHFVIAKPSVGLSTAEVFGQLPNCHDATDTRTSDSQAKVAALVSALRRGSLASAALNMTNRLEGAAARLAPWLASLRELFRSAGCTAQFMTGSGSAYVGLMRSASHARQTASRLKNLRLELGIELGHVFATSSC